MKNSIKVTMAIALSGIALWRCGTSSSTDDTIVHQSTAPSALPSDVLPSCTVTPATFNTWFASGTATENGMVTPANSVTFPHQNNCDFYQWSERMFLWATSPASGVYGKGNTVLESPVFFSVSPENSDQKRILIPHEPGVPLRMVSHLDKNGPDRLPVIVAKNGGIFEVETPVGGGRIKAMVKSEAGAVAEVDHVASDNKGGFIFMDKAGKVIPHPKAVIRHKGNQQKIVQQFAVGKQFIFLDAAGNIIESETGQATRNGLMTKNGALVYYLTFVNDVYAWYLTGVNGKQLNGNQFPTTAGARDSICALARAHNVTLPDSNALAIEIKSSWVEASSLPDPNNYITTMASIPTYDTSNPQQWLINGKKTVKMAMIGIHVVGSVAGHPEMVWATFEHKNNTPNAAYAYLDADSNKKIVPQDKGSHWLFNANASDTPYNLPHIHTSGDTLTAESGYPISPSNTLRSMPWGSAMDSVTNQEDLSSAASNSEIIAINNSIQSLLMGKDVRKNYLFIGATWTDGGAAPTGTSYGSDTTPGVSIGTNVLANSTMETYIQEPSTSCFTCHSGSPASLNPGSLSHIFSQLQPLINAYNRNKKKEKK